MAMGGGFTVPGDAVPPGWTEQFLQAQGGTGKGASMRYGMRPTSPDTVAERGTPEWRAAFKAQREWMNNQIRAGGSLHDLGFDPIRGQGLHAYTALREGDFSPFDSSWARAARGSAHGVYDSKTGAYTQTRGMSPGYGQPKARGAFDPVVPPGGFGPVTPDPNAAEGPSGTGGGSFYTPTPTDTYMTNPRRRGLRGMF